MSSGSSLSLAKNNYKADFSRRHTYKSAEHNETNSNATPVTTATIPYFKGTSETIARILHTGTHFFFYLSHTGISYFLPRHFTFLSHTGTHFFLLATRAFYISCQGTSHFLATLALTFFNLLATQAFSISCHGTHTLKPRGHSTNLSRTGTS